MIQGTNQLLKKNPRIVVTYYLSALNPILEFFDNYQPLLG